MVSNSLFPLDFLDGIYGLNPPASGEWSARRDAGLAVFSGSHLAAVTGWQAPPFTKAPGKTASPFAAGNPDKFHLDYLELTFYNI
jgi:hypothetical protein